MDILAIAISVAGALFVSGILSLVSIPRILQWEDRGFTGLPVSWRTAFLLAGAGAVASSLAGSLLGAGILPAISLALLGWMTVLVVITDFWTLKIPREPSIIAYWAGVPLAVGYALQIGSWAPIAAMFAFLFLPGLLIVLSMRGGLGFGDIRLLILFGTTLGWWVGFQYMFYALIMACVLQIAFFIFAKATGRGKVAEVGKAHYETASVPSLVGEDDDDEEDIAAASSMERIGGAFRPVPENKEAKKQQEKAYKKKQKLHLPFGPALMFSYLALGIYAATQYISTCDIFLMFFCGV